MVYLFKTHQRLNPLAQLHLKTYKHMLFDHKVVEHINLREHDIIMAHYVTNS